MSTTQTKLCPTCGATVLHDARFCVECGGPLTSAGPGSYSKQIAQKSSRSAKSSPKGRGGTAQVRSVAQTQDEPPPTSMSEALASVTGSTAAVTEPSSFAPGATPKRTGKSQPPPPPSARKSGRPPASQRPKAPAFGQPTAKPGDVPSKAELEMEWADLEQGFDSILSDVGAEPQTQTHSEPTSADVAAVEKLFKEIAVTQLGPVRDFMVEIDMGDPTKEWLSVCLPAVATLKKSADSMGVTTIIAPLDRLNDALQAAQSADGNEIGSSQKTEIVDAYNALAKELPDVYEAGVERDRREPIIVQSLLRQVPGVREVALDKIYAAGLNSLKIFLQARPQEIAETTGLNLLLCEDICRRFASYKTKHDSVAPGAKRPSELDELASLSRELQAANEAYERGQKGWSADAAKDRRQARKRRTDTLLRVNLVLARLGAVDLVNELERLPFERKVIAIYQYLEAAQKAQKS